jgi:hypothetical protein
MKTVWIYVDTNKKVGDVDHLKVFPSTDAADRWFKKNDPCWAALAMNSGYRNPPVGMCRPTGEKGSCWYWPISTLSG